VKRLYVAISHHGYGHLAQTAAILERLFEARPDLDLVLRTALPEAVLAARIPHPFRHLRLPTDCNFVMRDALRIDLDASLAAYRAFHRDWAARVSEEARALAREAPDLVFSNVGYLPLAAAREAGVPALALCSINWADLFRHYLGHSPGADAILADMADGYDWARPFLRPEPAMPMPTLAQGRRLPPVVSRRPVRRAESRATLGLASDERAVLVGLGGIPHRLPMEAWPRLAGVRWWVPDDWAVRHPDARAFSDIGMTYPELLAACDALITKPGYGSYTEAVGAGVPVLTLPRADWPETPYLLEWLMAHGRARVIPEAVLESGRLEQDLAALWAMPEKPVPEMNGAAEAARIILEHLV